MFRFIAVSSFKFSSSLLNMHYFEKLFLDLGQEKRFLFLTGTRFKLMESDELFYL